MRPFIANRQPYHEAWLSLACAAAVLLHGTVAPACERATPWSRLTTSARNTATPLPLALAGSALVAPQLMAPSGVDHQLRLLSQRELGGRPNLEPVSVWTPFVLPALLVATGAIALAVDGCEVARPTSAMLQSMGISLVAVVGLKWVTGRSWPNAGRDPNAPDRLAHPEFATTFHWFSWSQGSAWPSGHTATMAAAATALTTATGGRSWLGYLGIVGATGVAAGMWLGDHHWGSDIVSGGLLGAAFGYSVGLAFRDAPEQRAVARYVLLPWKTQDVTGLRVASTW